MHFSPYVRTYIASPHLHASATRMPRNMSSHNFMVNTLERLNLHWWHGVDWEGYCLYRDLHADVYIHWSIHSSTIHWLDIL